MILLIIFFKLKMITDLPKYKNLPFLLWVFKQIWIKIPKFVKYHILLFHAKNNIDDLIEACNSDLIIKLSFEYNHKFLSFYGYYNISYGISKGRGMGDVQWYKNQKCTIDIYYPNNVIFYSHKVYQGETITKDNISKPHGNGVLYLANGMKKQVYNYICTDKQIDYKNSSLYEYLIKTDYLMH